MSWDEFFCPVLMEVYVLCYRLPYRSVVHLAIVFKIYGRQTAASALEIDGRSTPDQGCKQDVTWFSSFRIISHVNVYFLTPTI
jgi:hypothetical protein